MERCKTGSPDQERKLRFQLAVLGCFHFSPRDVAQARELLLAGGLDLDSLISGHWPLEQLPEAMQALARGDGLQYAIDAS